MANKPSLRGGISISSHRLFYSLVPLAALFEMLFSALAIFATDFFFSSYYLWSIHFLAFLGFMVATRSWNQNMFRDSTAGFVAVTRAGVFSIAGYALLASMLNSEFDLLPLILASLILTASALTARWAARRIVVTLRGSRKLLQMAVVIGSRVEIESAYVQMGADPGFGYAPVDGWDIEVSKEIGSQIPNWSDESAIRLFLERSRLSGASGVFVSRSVSRDQQTFDSVLWDAKVLGFEVYSYSSLDAYSHLRVEAVPVFGNVLLRLDTSSHLPISRLKKRAFDLVFGGALLLLTLPLQMIICALVFVFDRQWPIFSQTRVGWHGEEFEILKFRTMRSERRSYPNLAPIAANLAGNEVQFKLKLDPRATRLGRVLRRYSLDELPQLFNVLLGSMSLVGPRPHVSAEVEKYDSIAERRLSVKPGLTGPWQVGGRSDLNWNQSIALDLGYMSEWSLTLDLVILVRTIWSVIRGGGAY
jgi:exopolysaccharide biosynthesis polyprenyl glycosylphosphotransferase